MHQRLPVVVSLKYLRIWFHGFFYIIDDSAVNKGGFHPHSGRHLFEKSVSTWKEYFFTFHV